MLHKAYKFVLLKNKGVYIKLSEIHKELMILAEMMIRKKLASKSQLSVRYWSLQDTDWRIAKGMIKCE